MSTTEPTINDSLAELLKTTRAAWREPGVVNSESTGMLSGSADLPDSVREAPASYRSRRNTSRGLKPDVLVLEPTASPVAVETEVGLAATVQDDATARLGQAIRTTGQMIQSAVAVRLPIRLREACGRAVVETDMRDASDLEFAMYTGKSPETAVRWPASGWIRGGVSSLSAVIQAASVPPTVIEAAADRLVEGVSDAAGLMDEMARRHSGAFAKVGQELRQQDGIQTRRMAATILANAFVFQESLAGGPGDLADVASIEELRGMESGLTRKAVLDEWRKILKINYWPIFDIARRILQIVPSEHGKVLIERLAATATRLTENRLMRSHDLTGAVFQRLIADRKFLAAYYTRPASAALLTGLALDPNMTPAGGSWANAKDVKSLRIADFACGTGTLLSTAYHCIGQLHELSGGDAALLHADMMANGMVGCDVVPAASHLTASMLAGIHPTVKYESGAILTLAFGRQIDGGVALGSLDLLEPRGTLEIIPITARAIEGMGQREKDIWLELPDTSFDMVIMNPPFTRSTVHTGITTNVPYPAFAAFGATKEDQRLMKAALKTLTAGTSYHGNAGSAAAFLVLADRKVKQGGVLAMVMPLVLVSGPAWERSRAMIAKSYSRLMIVSIAGTKDEDSSFSADTGMAECLLVGRKGGKSRRATFVVLRERPAANLAGETTAAQIRQLDNVRRLEDGPFGGTPIEVGSELVGQAIDAPLSASNWYIGRVADLSLAQAAYQLARNGRIWLPTMGEEQSVTLPITTLGAAKYTVGLGHREISGVNRTTGKIRGPFDIVPLTGNYVPSYPALREHDAERERTILFDADSEARPRRAASTEQIEKVWASASYCHFNLEFRFNSQPTSMQCTRRKTIGCSAWISISLQSEGHERALAAWANTTLGLLLHWWHSSKQQSGKGRISRTSLKDFAILDIMQLDGARLRRAVGIFNSVAEKPMKPLHQLHGDEVRRELDERFALEVLCLPAALTAIGGPLELLRMKLAQEPSIRGAK